MKEDMKNKMLLFKGDKLKEVFQSFYSVFSEVHSFIHFKEIKDLVIVGVKEVESTFLFLTRVITR